MEGRNYAQQEAIVAGDSDVLYKCQKSILCTVFKAKVSSSCVHVALEIMPSSGSM